jgi:hypothetical protein
VLALRIWRTGLAVGRRQHREPLPDLVRRLADVGPLRPRVPPRRLSRATVRALSAGGRPPRCLLAALVLYRLLREQGDPAELVIGLPDDADGPDAHAWVELDGVDLGPFPGRHHVPLARLP